jgi:hypothetical protein
MKSTPACFKQFTERRAASALFAGFMVQVISPGRTRESCRETYDCLQLTD